MTMQAQGNLMEVRVDEMKTRRHTHGPAELNVDKRQLAKMSSKSNDYVYVNPAYVGSTNNLNQERVPTSTVIAAPTAGVYREQYWACSKWPYGQRILAIAVGLMLGTIIGLAISIALSSRNNMDLGGFFHSPSAPG